MFSVFSKSGRIFSGSMEDMAKISPVAALARSSRVTATVAMPGPMLHSDHDLSHRSAVAAYASTVREEVVRRPLTRVADIMSTDVIALQETAPLGEAWTTLAKHNLGQAPVVNQHAMLVGMLTRAELMRVDQLPGPQAHALVWKAMLLKPVSDCMVTPIPSVDPETDIRRLARVLLDTGLPGLPVSDTHGRVIGFVSRTDILHAVVADPPLDLWT